MYLHLIITICDVFNSIITLRNYYGRKYRLIVVKSAQPPIDGGPYLFTLENNITAT